MDPKEARAHLHDLLTLHIRQQEAFGPLALSFIRDNDLNKLELLPEEQFNLVMAVVQTLADEPKRFNQKIELLKRARELVTQTRFNNPQLLRQLDFDIQKTQSDRNLYDEAMRVPRREGLEAQKLIVQSEIPDYMLNLAQKRAAAYYQEKYALTKEARAAQQFSGAPRKFEPDNKAVHKEFPGACGPFMNARTNAHHLMLPFDLKISRRPDDALDAIMKIFYCKMGYSFPLAYEAGQLCNLNDGQVVDIGMDDPNLLFVSASAVKEREFQHPPMETSVQVPPQFEYPVAVIERTGSLGPYIQIVTNYKVWFDASVVSLLIQGAPDLHEYGLQGGSGLMTRSHAADKIDAYADALKDQWKDGLSFNFVNIHLSLMDGVESAFVPYNTPLFTLYPTLNQQCYKVEDSRNMG